MLASPFPGETRSRGRTWAATSVIRRPPPPHPSPLLLSIPVLQEMGQKGRCTPDRPSWTSPSCFPQAPLSPSSREGLGALDLCAIWNEPLCQASQCRFPHSLVTGPSFLQSHRQAAMMGTDAKVQARAPLWERSCKPCHTGPSHPSSVLAAASHLALLSAGSGPGPAPFLCPRQQQAM